MKYSLHIVHKVTYINNKVKNNIFNYTNKITTKPSYVVPLDFRAGQEKVTTILFTSQDINLQVAKEGDKSPRDLT